MPLWRFPGRAEVLSGITRTMLTAVVLATGLRLDRGVSTVYIPADVHYRGLIRAQQIAPGIPASAQGAPPHSTSAGARCENRENTLRPASASSQCTGPATSCRSSTTTVR